MKENVHGMKPSRSGCHLLNSNEDWQFENPLVSVGADGTVKSRLKATPGKTANHGPVVKPIREFLESLKSKEVDDMDFIKLDMDKQIKLVADGYNEGLGPSAIQRKLGIKGAGTYYNRLDKAKAMGLVTEMRGQGTPVSITTRKAAEVVPEVVVEPAPVVAVDDFARVAAEKIEQAEKLAKEAERLQRAGHIAQTLTELLGDQAGDLVAGLYSKVSV